MSTPELNLREGSVQSQPVESGKIVRTIPGSNGIVEYYDGSFWLRLSPEEWEVAGITTGRARQLLGRDIFDSFTQELAQKELPLPTKTAELVTGIQQTIRDFLSNGWRTGRLDKK